MTEHWTPLVDVRINLGAGEGEVTSPPDRRLDDLLWHVVDVQRKDADVALTIDGVHVSRIKLPGRFYELNIHYGVFIGGMGDFSEIFLGLLDNFRGCLHQVRFNDVPLFPTARERGTAFGVTWGCDKQFDADADVSLSFVGEHAFAMLPPLLPHAGGTLRLDLKTAAADGLIVYNDAGRRGRDHVMATLRDGRLRLRLEAGGRRVQLDSKVAVNDGVWHKAQLTVGVEYVELSVDQTLTSVKPDNGTNFQAFASNLFVGGLSEKNRIRAAKQGIEDIPVDLRGCVQNLFVDDVLTGLPSVVESLGVQAECVWEYPCLRDPCVPGGVCVPQGVAEFRCDCEQPVCVRADFTSQYGVFTDARLPGGEALLTTANVQLVLDYEKYGVRDSGVFFHVREPPKQGVISVDVWRRPDESVFTLLDLLSDRVRYLHGGAESGQDVVVFELELFARAGFTLPAYLQARHKFVLHVAVTPDPDSRPRELVFTLLSPAEVDGHLELARRPDEPVDSFTQEQVDDGQVLFVHGGGGGDTRLALRVSDGQATSETTLLRVVTFRLEAVAVNNTGLRVTHGSSALITTANLSFTTNAQDEQVGIKFVIVKQTQSGKVQKLRGNGHWQPTSHFTMRHLKRRRVRYRHTTGTPDHDGFRFQVVLQDATQPAVHDFRIQFLTVSVQLVTNRELVLNRTQEAAVTRDFLYAEPRPFPQPAENLSFVVTSTPRFGDLFRLEGSPARRQALPVGVSFSQRDVDAGRVVYRLHRKSYSAFTDLFRFRVHIPGFESPVHEFNMRHVPPAPKGMISIKRIEVGEGDAVAIMPRQLSIEIDGIATVFYNDIAAGRVLYAHDDSENPSDAFGFVATSLNPDDDFQYVGVAELTFSDPDLYTEPSDISYTRRGIPNGALYLHPDYNTEVFGFTQADIDADRLVFQHGGVDRSRVVLWVSDGAHYTTGVLEIAAAEPFVRLNGSAAPLTVPRGDSQQVTADRLRPETNVEVADENVRFHVTAPPQRGRLRVRGEPAAEFSFQDVQQGAVEYEASEASGAQDSVGFEVRVGKLASNGSLSFRIYPESYWEPLRVVNNRSALVPEGDMVTVSQSLLHVMHPNVAPGDIRFTVTKGPTYGFLMLRGPDARPKVVTFDQAFINDGNLTYVQSVANATEDRFVFTVTNGIVSMSGLQFDVLVKSRQVRLVTWNLTLSEGGQVALTPRALTVASRYYRQRVSGFRYVHSGDEFREDCLTLVVSADSKTSAPGPLCFVITGVNDHPPSLVNNSGLVVVEGGAVAITTDQLDAVDADRPAVDLTFSVTRSECGNVSLQSEPGVPVSNFTRSQLAGGQVIFSHTQPEASRCSLRVTVSDGVHQTPPESCSVRVERLRLQLVANTQLHVFPMMQQSITKGHLLVRTNDPRTPRTITYSVIRKPQLGKITREQPDGSTAEISWFTQQELNRSLVLYEHRRPLGALSAEDSVELRVETPPAEPLRRVRLRIAVSADISAGRLSYRHDHSDTRADSFGYSLFLATPTSDVLLYNGTVNVTVTPVNDQKFRLQTTAPGLTVVQKQTAAIGRDNLLVTDPDNAPAEILFTIINGPSRGSVFFKETPHVRVSNFSQEDVDRERLLYAQDGSLGADQFYFSVWDGQHSPLVTGFGITVVPLSLSIERNELVPITQGQSRVTLDPQHVVFNVTVEPAHGRLFVGADIVTTFTQADIDNGRVAYMQMDLQAHNDSFVASVYNEFNAVRNETFSVASRPLNIIFFVAADASLEGNETLADAVRFELTANGVQPARGSLAVELVSAATLEADKALPGVNSVVGRDRPADAASFMRSDYVLVAGVVIGVVITSILLLIVVNRASTPDFINSTLPRPSTISTLPRPEPMASRPRLSANGSLPRPRFLERPRLLEPGWPERDVSPCVPQCTVTPLYTGAPPSELTYSYDVDTDRQFCDDGWSHDGSEVSASQPSNPILRKNQYWV
ncbi:chondroitin sulfate proteoglycan 4-like [Pollicipes pollicipes]|uniref:chondroitin sulfate proteoglycan 4-like n=1 Tax=Pollicipes pollicipes TaxID=41117 RepID=UPI0018850714|nr:chondroitin sulfate proteoglycan 4-like [Pollicipes pollicipes]